VAPEHALSGLPRLPAPAALPAFPPSQVVLEGARELACLAVQDRLVAAGSRFHIHLLDLRQRCAAAGTIPLTDNGVRSLQLAGHVLSAGTGDAGVAFFDLRYLRRAKGPRLRDLTPGVGLGVACTRASLSVCVAGRARRCVCVRVCVRNTCVCA
jgi:hypothetical protein